MVAAIRQTVKVQPGGVVHFSSPELREGSEAEIIVLVTAPPEPAQRLAAFQALGAKTWRSPRPPPRRGCVSRRPNARRLAHDPSRHQLPHRQLDPRSRLRTSGCRSGCPPASTSPSV